MSEELSADQTWKGGKTASHSMWMKKIILQSSEHGNYFSVNYIPSWGFTTSDTNNSAFNKRKEIYDRYGVDDGRIANSHIGKPDLPSSSDRVNASRPILSYLPDSPLESPTAFDANDSASNQRNKVDKGYGNGNGFGMVNSLTTDSIENEYWKSTMYEFS